MANTKHYTQTKGTDQFAVDVIEHGKEYALARVRFAITGYSAFQISQFEALADAKINIAAAEILR